MNFEIKKLYKCSSDYLLIYPSKEKASLSQEVSAMRAHRFKTHLEKTGAEFSAEFWSKRLNCEVHYSIPNESFMVLKEIEKINNWQYINVLFSVKIGWIVYHEKLNIGFEKLV